MDFLLKLGTPLTYFLIPASPRLEKTKAYIRITDSFPTPTLTPYPHHVLGPFLPSVGTTVEWWQPRRQCLGMLGGIPKSLEKREAAADSRAVFQLYRAVTSSSCLVTHQCLPNTQWGTVDFFQLGDTQEPCPAQQASAQC